MKNRDFQRFVSCCSWSFFFRVFLTIFWVEPDEIGRCLASGDAEQISEVKKRNTLVNRKLCSGHRCVCMAQGRWPKVKFKAMIKRQEISSARDEKIWVLRTRALDIRPCELVLAVLDHLNVSLAEVIIPTWRIRLLQAHPSSLLPPPVGSLWPHLESQR